MLPAAHQARPMLPSWALFGVGTVLVAGTGVGALPEVLGRLLAPVALVLLFHVSPGRALLATASGVLLLLLLAGDLILVGRTALPVGASGLLLGRGFARRLPPRRVIAEGVLPFVLVSLPFFFHPSVEEARAAEVEKTVATSMNVYRGLGEDEATLAGMEGMVRSAAQAAATVAPATEVLLLLAITLLVYRLSSRLLRRYGVTVNEIAPFRWWRAPFILVWFFAAGLALLLWAGVPLADVGGNVVVFCAGVYLVQGTAVLAWQCKRRRIPAAAQWILFAAMVLLVFPLFLVLTTGTGLFDTWFDFRKLGEAPENGSAS